MVTGRLFFILIDNLRYDQFKIINPIISEYFRLEEEDTYYSICLLPHNMPVTPFLPA
jgi:hypothetical protein